MHSFILLAKAQRVPKENSVRVPGCLPFLPHIDPVLAACASRLPPQPSTVLLPEFAFKAAGHPRDSRSFISLRSLGTATMFSAARRASMRCCSFNSRSSSDRLSSPCYLPSACVCYWLLQSAAAAKSYQQLEALVKTNAEVDSYRMALMALQPRSLTLLLRGHNDNDDNNNDNNTCCTDHSRSGEKR
jgi:hypothetical protein